MRQLFLDKGLLAIKEVGQPQLTDDTMLVAVHYSFISSGTESATIADSMKATLFKNISQKVDKIWKSFLEERLRGPKALIKERLHGGLIQQLGYSCSGQVVAVGRNITQFRPGDFVACAGVNIANHADVVCVPANLAVKINQERYVQAASITTLGAIALQGIRRAQLQLGETVCILGLGLLGQLSAQLARHAGCRVIGIDLIDDRLDIAKKYGAHVVFNAQDIGLKASIDFLTDHHGVDCTLITAASKSDMLVQQAMEITRRKGKVVVVGDVGLHLQRDPFYHKEIGFLISSSYGPGRSDFLYEQCGADYPYAYVRWTENRNMQAIVKLIEQEQLSVTPLISQCVDITNALDGYKKLQNKEGLGVLISYLPVDQQLLTDKHQKSEALEPAAPPTMFVPARKTTLRVGIIGAGGFARAKLLPILASVSNVKIEAVVDSNPSNAMSVARLYNVQKTFVDDEALFQEDLVDVVLIASPHIYHGDQIIKSLSRGKAVFAEKPMITTHEQLKKITTFLSTAPSQVPLCVDYNRSFAPFIQKIKEHIRMRTTPLMVHYRMNVGFIPKYHWTQTEIGGGRLIGEACHIFDLFCFLTDAKPVAISVETLHPQQESLSITDNASIQISFSDGSVCSLLYTAVGNNQASKERMELFFDGKTIIMDDYKLLHGFGLPASFNQTAKAVDKGHEYLMRQFFGALRSEKMVMPMSLDHLVTVAKVTLAVHDLATMGGGTRPERA